MLAVKAVKQNIETSEINNLLEVFRKMVNEAIRVGLERNITSRFKLSNAVYEPLHNGLHTWYILSAVEKACTLLKNYRKAKRKNPKTKKPHVKKPFLSIGNQAYKIIDGKLRLPTKPKQFIYVPLNKYTLKVLSEPNLKLGSITLTASTVSISFSKETAEIDPCGYVGIDRNLNNVTTASSNGEVVAYDLSKATRVKATYREVKSHFKRNDVRIRRKLFGKYGNKQRNKVSQVLHHASKDIVKRAKENHFGIAMENLKGIRKLYRKGNGQGKYYRSRLNSWSFYELQRQIEYKAKGEGISVVYVQARNTSKKCSICGLDLIPEENRVLKCLLHGIVDRDVNAARNVLARALRFGAVGQPVEAMVVEPSKAIHKVDGCQVSPKKLLEPIDIFQRKIG
jgi:putative transposase